MPSLVCTVCKDLAVPRSGLSGTRSALRDAAAAGCPKCAMLMEGASLIVPGWIDDQGEFQQPLFQSYQSQVMGAWNAAPDYPLWEMGKDEGGPGDSFDLNMKRHAQLDATFDISPTQEEMEVYFRGSRPETCESIIFFTIEGTLLPGFRSPFESLQARAFVSFGDLNQTRCDFTKWFPYMRFRPQWARSHSPSSLFLIISFHFALVRS